jgi:hypothetical protein
MLRLHITDLLSSANDNFFRILKSFLMILLSCLTNDKVVVFFTFSALHNNTLSNFVLLSRKLHNSMYIRIAELHIFHALATK